MAKKKKPRAERTHARKDSVMINLFVTEEQRARWDAAAKADDRDRSSWIRVVCDREAGLTAGEHTKRGPRG